MSDLLALLLLLSLLSIPIGLVYPRAVLWWSPRQTRGRALGFSLGLTILFILLYSIATPSFRTTVSSDQLAAWTKDRIEAEGATPTYEQLARNPDDWQGKPIKLTGQVVQVVDQKTLRVAITEDKYGLWSDAVIVIRKTEQPRILEDDIVKIWGLGDGIQRYIAIFGQSVEAPRVAAVAIKVEEEAGS